MIILNKSDSEPSTPSADYGIIFYKDGVLNLKRSDSAVINMAVVYPDLCNIRLSLHATDSDDTTDQTNKTVVYVHPYNGNIIAVPITSSTWQYKTIDSVLSIDMSNNSNYPVDTVYDIFIGNPFSGALYIVALPWTSNTARQTSISKQQGIYVATDPSTLDLMRYVGTIYKDSSGYLQDTAVYRYLWNYYNQRDLLLKSPSNDTLTNYGTAAIRPYNNDTNVRFNFVHGLNTNPIRIGIFSGIISSSNYHFVSVGLDSISVASTDICWYIPTDGRIKLTGEKIVNIGKHYVQMLQNATGGVLGAYQHGYVYGIMRG